MKKLLLLIFYCSGMAQGQILNSAGHLIAMQDDNSRISSTMVQNGRELQVNGLTLKGNSVFKLDEGYLTLSGNYENTPSFIRQYNLKGQCIFEKEYSQTINFRLSQSREFCAFHDMKQIHVLNLNNHKEYSVDGSQIFAINNHGELACYNQKESKVSVGIQGIRTKEAVYKSLFFKGKAYFATRTTLFRLHENVAETVYSTPEGRLFDMDVFGDSLFISIKREFASEFIFNSLCSSDGKNFKIKEEKHYLRKILTTPKRSLQPVVENSQIETFPNPLHYTQDTVYQEVGNSYFELQDYGPGYPYPHPGVDLMGVDQQPVYAVKKGYVQGVLTTSSDFHWRIALARKKTTSYSMGYLYAHLEETSMPFTYGDSVEAGEQIGLLVDFPVPGFVHCHFARIGGTGQFWEGNWTTFDDPLVYMDNFYDSIPPEFEKTLGNKAFAFRRHGNRKYINADSLYGNVSVISKFHDRINSTLWKSDVHRIRYQVSPISSPNTLLLDSASFEYHYKNDYYFYGPTFRPMVNLIYSRDSILFSQGDYLNRNYYHMVANTNGDDTLNKLDSLHSFQTADLPDGDYIFRIIAWDAKENQARDSMLIKIKNIATNTLISSGQSEFQVWPNPVRDRIHIRPTIGIQYFDYVIWNQTGSLVQTSRIMISQKQEIRLEKLPQGLYFMQIIDDQGKSLKMKFIKQD